MPNIEDGLITAIVGAVMGFVTSAIITAILPAAMPGVGMSLAVLFNLLFFLVGIEALQKAKYWGLMYSLGYFLGVAFIGKYFMESWECTIYLIVIGFYIVLKIINKL